jgi:hypothetical protein
MIIIDPTLEQLLRKFAYCQNPDDPDSDPEFVGAIKVKVVGGDVFLHVEETTWETPGGSVLDTKWIRIPHE